ncbi:unnamed protein product [Clonostachys rhizophaga]|uniref:Uncharacterized protein n=1 Tax=Clonostachys rhizophaga TaxID=160324 RepID=A0A9N9VPZ3_9HYPO|nr:unnamed protein product [Clonostachys rhizophaga]
MSTEGLMTPVPGVEPTMGGVYLWRYSPNVGAAALFLILFMATFLYTTWRIWRTRTLFCIAFAVGGFMEMVGYGIRAGVQSKTGLLMPFIIQNLFILVAPVLFAATIYMTLGRLITTVRGTLHSLVRPPRITLTFVLGDVLSFVIQGAGAGMSVVQNQNLAKWSERIVVIGLLIQVIMFALFCVLAVVFHSRMKQALASRTNAYLPSWEGTMIMLYVVSLLIMARSIFRVVEYFQGYTGYALSHEWTLYVFDSLLMFAATVVFAWKFPEDVVGQPGGSEDVNMDSQQSMLK